MKTRRYLGSGWISGLFAALTALFLLLPLIVVIPVSFTSKRFLSMPDGEWSLRHYQAILDWDSWLPSIGTSLIVAVLAATLSTVLATAFGIGIWVRRPRSAPFWIAFSLMPLIVPPVASAIAMYFLLAWMGLLDTITGLVISHTIMVVSFAVIAIMAALAQLDRDLERAARNLGASFRQTAIFVILPNLRFGVAAAWFLSFILSWEEASVTLFVSGVQVVTLPKRIWDNLRLNVDPVIASISVIMIVISLIVILALMFRRKPER